MKRHKNLWSLVILLILISITLLYLLKNRDLGKIIDLSAEVNPVYLIIGLLLMFVFVASEGLGIKTLLSSLRYKCSFLKSLKYSFLGFYYCSISPSSGGQPVQIYYMTREGIAFGDASLCIMLISVAYQIGILLICFASLLLRGGFILHNLGYVGFFALFGAIFNAFLVFLFLSTTFRNPFLEKAVNGIIRLAARIKLVKEPTKAAEKLRAHLEQYRKGASYLRSHPKTLFVTLGTIVVQVLSRLSVAYAVYKSFGLHEFAYLDILSLQAFLMIAIEYLPIPGLVGAAEAGFYRVNALIFGSANLLSATLLTRAISYYVFLLLSGIVSVFAHLSLSRGRGRSRIPIRQNRELIGADSMKNTAEN